MPGVEVEVRDANGVVVTTAITDSAGHYQTVSLDAGSYFVEPATNRDRYNPNVAPVNLSSFSASVNFLLVRNGFLVTGKVTLNGSGGEGAVGIPVQASCPTGGTTKTDTSGDYAFRLSRGTCDIAAGGVGTMPARREVSVTDDLSDVNFTTNPEPGKYSGGIGVFPLTFTVAPSSLAVTHLRTDFEGTIDCGPGSNNPDYYELPPLAITDSGFEGSTSFTYHSGLKPTVSVKATFTTPTAVRGTINIHFTFYKNTLPPCNETERFTASLTARP